MSGNDDTISITRLLTALRSGDRAAESDLWALVYDEVRTIAQRILKGEHGTQRLQTTALVHEAYLRLADGGTIKASDRAHFYALVARMMRQILVDGARQRGALKRGGGQEPESLSTLGDVASLSNNQLLELDITLIDLARLDEKKANIVELHFFGGYPFVEIGKLMNCSEKTVRRRWRVARLWLYTALVDRLETDHSK